MGKPDVALKQWLRNKVRFADLFNGIIFDGVIARAVSEIAPIRLFL